MPVTPDTVLRQLSELWVSLGKEQSDGVLRACSMTLIVLADDTDDQAAIGETLAALMPEHPSRAIVVRVPGGAPSMEARVFAQCWMPFGQRRHICCEQIEITAGATDIGELAAFVLPLTVPDLPVVLWCRSARLFALPGFSEFAKVARKLVIDSALLPDAGAALRTLAGMAQSGRVLGDLAWARITRWREAIAQIFENREYLARLADVARVGIAHTGEAVPVEARYLAAWVLGGLQKAGAAPALALERRQGPGDLVRASIGCAGGAIVSVERIEEHTAEVRLDGAATRMSFPVAATHDVMREELGIPGRDPVFEQTLAAAAQLAVSS